MLWGFPGDDYGVYQQIPSHTHLTLFSLSPLLPEILSYSLILSFFLSFFFNTLSFLFWLGYPEILFSSYSLSLAGIYVLANTTLLQNHNPNPKQTKQMPKHTKLHTKNLPTPQRRSKIQFRYKPMGCLFGDWYVLDVPVSFIYLFCVGFPLRLLCPWVWCIPKYPASQPHKSNSSPLPPSLFPHIQHLLFSLTPTHKILSSTLFLSFFYSPFFLDWGILKIFLSFTPFLFWLGICVLANTLLQKHNPNAQKTLTTH